MSQTSPIETRMNVGRCWSVKYRVQTYTVTVLALFVFQVFAGRTGGAVANQFSYQSIDYHDIYAWLSVHHFVQMLVALALIAVLGKLLQLDFGLKLGDIKQGKRSVLIFTAAFAGFTLISHILMRIYNMLPVFDFPLNVGNVLGTLGFQLLLSGPSEEILYRAIPITVLIYVTGRNVSTKHKLTLETIIASLLFAVAHTTWSLSPLSLEIDYFRVFYAFTLGTISGVTYQKTHSILYPMLMHSISNVLMVGTGYLFTLL